MSKKCPVCNSTRYKEATNIENSEEGKETYITGGCAKCGYTRKKYNLKLTGEPRYIVNEGDKIMKSHSKLSFEEGLKCIMCNNYTYSKTHELCTSCERINNQIKKDRNRY